MPDNQDRRTKTVAESIVRISQLMRPHHANFAGNVHGGVLLGLMDEAAYLCASTYAEGYCVTVAVDHVEFRAPVRVGDMVTLTASVNAVGRTSMQVGIAVEAKDPHTPESIRRTNRSYFTMVAKDDEGRSMPVPTLMCGTEEERRLECEAQLRRELRQRFEEELERGVCAMEESGADGGAATTA